VLTIVEGPPSNTDPCLQALFSFFQCSKSTDERSSIFIHGCDLKGIWLEKHKGKIEVRVSLKINVFWRYGDTRSRICPSLIVADGPCVNCEDVSKDYIKEVLRGLTAGVVFAA
jgi:hypothetical protein